MFSPYYAWAGRRDPTNHCALNVCLYGDGWKRWAMTERRRGALRLEPDGVSIGPSSLRWAGDRFEVAVHETSVPHLGPVRGKVIVRPEAVQTHVYRLDAAGRHFWRPIAPVAEIEVALEQPRFAWRGAGYFDMNWGSEPLEAGFTRWDWMRAPLPGRDGGAMVFYDAARRAGGEDLALALRFDRAGGVSECPAPARSALPRTLWRVARTARGDAEAPPRPTRMLEDAPFYARAEIRTRLFGADVAAMHETFDGDRFANPWVRALLPARMPRSLR